MTAAKPAAGSAPQRKNKKAGRAGGRPHRAADPLKPFEDNLRSWRLKLRNDRDGAAVLVDSVVRRLEEKGLFHPSELARFKANMMSGVTCPGEYGISENHGCLKVGC